MPQIDDNLVTIPPHPYLLVTVGTTRFDNLIKQLDNNIESLLNVCNGFGISTILLQIGATQYQPQNFDRIINSDSCAIATTATTTIESSTEITPPQETTTTTTNSNNGVKSIQWFRYATDFSLLLQNASLVISHAGAGSILETLRST
eukprot:UN00900